MRATVSAHGRRNTRLEPHAGKFAKRHACEGPRFCNDCTNTGCRGRFGIFEIFVIDDETRKLIYDKATASVLRAHAREMGMRTLREDGIRKVLAGLTTAEEVIRATVGDES